MNEAEENAERVIINRLHAVTPAWAVVAEEAIAQGLVPEVTHRFWRVDPLSGAKEFIDRNGEFTINVAPIDCREPVLCVACAPARDQLFAGR